MASNGGSKILVTGATGYLGSHVVKELLHTTTHKVIGTTSSLQNTGRIKQFRKSIGASPNFELLEANMVKDKKCFDAILDKQQPQFVIHTACPFMEGMNLNSNLNEVNGYVESTKCLIDGVIE